MNYLLFHVQLMRRNRHSRQLVTQCHDVDISRHVWLDLPWTHIHGVKHLSSAWSNWPRNQEIEMHESKTCTRFESAILELGSSERPLFRQEVGIWSFLALPSTLFAPCSRKIVTIEDLYRPEMKSDGGMRPWPTLLMISNSHNLVLRDFLSLWLCSHLR